MAPGREAAVQAVMEEIRASAPVRPQHAPIDTNAYECVRDVAKDYPEIAQDDRIIDAACMHLVMKPEQFDEYFTIGLTAAGEPVERPVRAMTGDEFLMAWEWHRDSAARLEEESAAVLDRLFDKAEKERLTAIERRAVRIAIERMRAAGTEYHKTGRLMQMACALMPQWVYQPQVTVADAVRQWWPSGKAA